MKKLQTYVLQSTAKAFVPAFLALALLVIVGLCMQFLRQGLDVLRLGSLLPAMLVNCVPMVLPAAFLTAVIMTFGRLSADNELIAVRAAGIHLFSIVQPVVVAAAVLSLVAGYFQFEALPRAQGSMQAHKYAALKQILLDRVALSWRRQFSFPPLFIHYESFHDGMMHNLRVVEMRNDRPQAIITADRSTVEPDPSQPEVVRFVMSDCLITKFDLEAYGEPRTIKSEKVITWVRVAPEAEDLLSRRKYMPLGPLLSEVRRLRTVLAGATGPEDAEAAVQEVRRERARITESLRRLATVLDDQRAKLIRYGEQEPRRQQAIIDRDRQAIQDSQRQLDDLRRQIAEVARQADQMTSAAADLERLVELQRHQRSLLTQVEATKVRLTELAAQVAEAQSALESARTAANDLRVGASALEGRRNELLSQLTEVNNRLGVAAAREDLESVIVRIHKRLAQAFSVFAFALVGIPLGMVAGRRSVMMAFGISFAVVLLVFYPFLILGGVAADAGVLPPGPAIWAGNGVTVLIGIVLMAKVLGR